LILTVFAVKYWFDAQAMPTAPEKMSLSEITARLSDEHPQLWVEIQDGDWDCTSFRHYTVNDMELTDALLVNPTGTIVAIAGPRGYATCAMLAGQTQYKTGVVSRYRKDWLADKISNNENGIQRYQDAQFLELCLPCSPSSTLQMSFNLLMVAYILGLTYPIALVLRRFVNRKQFREKKHLTAGWQDDDRRKQI
jgi:hypothetical protein